MHFLLRTLHDLTGGHAPQQLQQFPDQCISSDRMGRVSSLDLDKHVDLVNSTPNTLPKFRMWLFCASLRGFFSLS
jgi:hypothetical protein